MDDKYLRQEYTTVLAMLKIYCKAHHINQSGVNSLCEECEGIALYSKKRLTNCPHKEKKPTCGNCTIHCYKPDMQKNMREIMRYSGPRMLYHHPIMAIRHLIQSKFITKPTKNKSVRQYRNKETS